MSILHQGAACDAASVHFGPTIRRTDVLVRAVVQQLTRLQLSIASRGPSAIANRFGCEVTRPAVKAVGDRERNVMRREGLK